jgi:aryl-phospho-beta-D-glucosidase BglC (GH1 family)
MEQEKIFDDISNLPPEAQQQVADFIAFLRTRYKRSDAEKQTTRINLINEPFIGIWKDREDMKNTSKWLRNVRKAEWGATS